MDGCLCDFDGEYTRISGIRWDYTLASTIEEKKAKWANLSKHPEFFLNLPWIPGSKELMNFIRNNYPIEEIGILSAQTQNIDFCAEQKHSWIKRELPWIFKENRHIVDSPLDKIAFAKKGDILVDDLLSTIEKWETAGGIGVLFENAIKTQTLFSDFRLTV